MATSRWLTSRKRKKHQRRMNKLMRLMNENIKNDDLWAGRYEVRQGSYSSWCPYEDHSGNELWVHLILLDKLTGQKKVIAETVNHYNIWNGSHLWQEMNDFIVDWTDAWHQEPRPGTKEYKEMIDKYVKEGWPYGF